MARPRTNTAKLLSVAGASLFAIGGIYYGLLLFDSFGKMRYTVLPSEDGMALTVSEGIAPRAIPYLIALALMILFAVVQGIALIRPSFVGIAAVSSAVPLAFPLFTDVTLAEFTLVGILPPADMIKFFPFVLACLFWAAAGLRSTAKEG